MSLLTYHPPCRRPEKPLVWLHCAVKTPPMSQAARIQTGYLLRRLQGGEFLLFPESRPMPAIGRACHEIRLDDGDVTWRIFYRIDLDALVILDVVKKKTQATPRPVIETCRRRLAAYDQLLEEEN
jgi:phage-related protein